MAGATLISGKDSTGNYRTARIGDDGHLGSSKSDHQNGPGTLNGNYSWIEPHAASVITLTSANMTGDKANIPLATGQTFRCCSATQIVVVSGRITAYYV